MRWVSCILLTLHDYVMSLSQVLPLPICHFYTFESTSINEKNMIIYVTVPVASPQQDQAIALACALRYLSLL